jgi:DNA gyrase/topoisomerase IV subunit B/DNA gyrase/topoisomerase IV subunit A
MLSPKKTVRKGALSADDYKGLSDKGHIYQITDTYIGSDEQTEREEWVFRFAKNQLEKRKIKVSQAVERLFLEILSNAGDNSFSSRNSGVDPGDINIHMSDTWITIRNGGLPIPIEINKEMNLYAPEMIFGVLRTSANYDKNVIRMGCGRNGFGAKLVNIFSKEFKIDVGDSIRKKRYRQTWKNNMDVREEPIIESYKGPSYVEVSYLMDFQRFGYTENKYPAEAFALFGRLALEMSMNCKVPLMINEVKYDVVNIQNFCKFIFPEEALTTAIVHIEAEEPLYVEICLMDTPDSGEILSYVNGMITRDGGVHVEAAIKAISNVLLDKLNNSKTVKNINKDDTKKKNILTLADIRPHISMVMSCRVPDPKFTSQTKTQLSGPQLKFEFPDKVFQQIFKWSLITRLYATLEAKQMKNLQKTDGKKRRHILLEKGEDANEAGGPNSKKCTLFIVEGKSAMGYAVKAISSINNGRNFYGILPIRGKLLNVMNANAQQIAENEELIEIKKMIGLKEGMDYTSPENFATLRYGYIVILTDADDDGKHITGLLLNFFFCRFQSLLARGYIYYLRTPILRVYQAKQVLKFYSAGEYETWKEKTPNALSWKHRYYKGLGTSKDTDILDDFKAPKMVMCIYDDSSSDSFKLAFDSKFSNQRKSWIATWKKAFDIEDLRQVPISKFINEEFIQFSVSNLHRSIPRMMDGLKISQRKVLWAAFQHWKAGGGGLVKNPKEIKVERFASITAEATNYHHGGNCLSETIISMAQNFVGSNNMPYFTQDGQFGCVAPDTPVLLWNGETKLAKDITTEDVLIGDDGKPRHVSQVVSGEDHMYQVSQSYGKSYVVNSLHILTLKCLVHKQIFGISTMSSGKSEWLAIYFDKKSESLVYTYNESYDFLKEMMKDVSDENIFDIHIAKYLCLNMEDQKYFVAVQNSVPIAWENNISLSDSYQYGLSWEEHDQIDRKWILSESRENVLDGIVDMCGKLNTKKISHNSCPNRFVESGTLVNIKKHFSEFEYLVKSLGIPMKEIEKGSYHLFAIFNSNGHYLLEKELYSRIKIKHLGIGPYCGWYLDSNERFLLGDFTVTHNTRNMGGEDASAPRYPDTRPQEWIRYVYRTEDFPLMDRVIDEGNEVEPFSFLPILPMALINGCLGIGTGHSTFIPNCSPMEIVDWLLSKLERKSSMPSVLPWYRGFTGNIKIKTAMVKQDDFFDHVSEDEETREGGEENGETSDKREEETQEVTLSMVTTGKVQVDKKTNIHIQELPIGIWTHKYKEFLEHLLEEKRIVDFANLSTHDVPKFVIQGFQGKPTFEKLKLVRNYGLTNMVLLDMNNIPKKFKSIDELLETFYKQRLPYYGERKRRMIEDLSARIKVLEDKYKFLKLVIEDKIIIFKKTKQEILAQMKVHKVPEELLTNVRLSSLSEDELKELMNEIEELRKEKEEIQKLPPEQMWINDLKEFRTKYIELFGKDIKEELEGDELESDDETIPYTKPKKPKKQMPMSEHRAKRISKVGNRLKTNGEFMQEKEQEKSQEVSERKSPRKENKQEM